MQTVQQESVVHGPIIARTGKNDMHGRSGRAVISARETPMRNALSATLALAATILGVAAPWARGQTERFTAASLKPLPPPAVLAAPPGEEIVSERVVRAPAGRAASPGVVSPGRLHSVATLKEFLASAYDVKEFQIEGPSWLDAERFVLDATMPLETTAEQRRWMLRNLLVDRFKVTIHHDTRELPIYSLVVAKNGPKVKESPEASETAPPGSNVRTVTVGGRVRITAEHETMQDLASCLTRQLDRPVKDATGLTRKYDFMLTFSSEGLSGSANPAGGLPATAPSEDAGPGLFAAVQAQLGLRLEAQKGLVELVVIDHIERTPAAN